MEPTPNTEGRTVGSEGQREAAISIEAEETDQPSQPSQRKSVSAILDKFASNTTVHGVPRLIEAENVTKRVVWSIVCVLAFGLFLGQSITLVVTYYSYPTKINMRIEEKELEFPWVSVCNNGNFDILTQDFVSRLAAGTHKEKHYQHLKTFSEQYEFFWTDSGFIFQHLLDVQLGSFSEKKTLLFDIYSYENFAANIGINATMEAGVDLQHLVINCQYQGNPCDINTTFDTTFDPYYTKCFTFKPKKRSVAYRSGFDKSHTLSLILFTGTGTFLHADEESFILPGSQSAEIASSRGMGSKVVVHSPHTKPHFLLDGFDIPAGYSTTISVKGKEFVRPGKPYSNCKKLGNIAGYTVKSCQRQCFQNLLIFKCGCADEYMPLNTTQNVPLCSALPRLPEKCFSNFDDSCESTVTKWYSSNVCSRKVFSSMKSRGIQATSECDCFPLCHETQYESSYSLSTTPRSESVRDLLKSFVKSLDPDRKFILQNNQSKQDMMRNLLGQVSRINVNIADNKVVQTIESPDYPGIRLLSVIGGALGLWIGISVISLFELLQLLSDIHKFVCGRVSKRKTVPPPVVLV